MGCDHPKWVFVNCLSELPAFLCSSLEIVSVHFDRHALHIMIWVNVAKDLRLEFVVKYRTVLPRSPPAFSTTGTCQFLWLGNHSIPSARKKWFGCINGFLIRNTLTMIRWRLFPSTLGFQLKEWMDGWLNVVWQSPCSIVLFDHFHSYIYSLSICSKVVCRRL